MVELIDFAIATVIILWMLVNAHRLDRARSAVDAIRHATVVIVSVLALGLF